ncbi:thioesterase II family protein [Rhodospirillum sp. A1_3_36]|uniref:thioesterase II family protein n=1 Tax=Rhodospirillum sp. A1_3_36 TaxID=3391666 RepID=UPI0039A70F01
MTPRADQWTRAYRLTPKPRLRLVCFAHAGGSASFFRSWLDALPAEVDLLAVRYPGREDRFNEGCLTDMASLAEGASRAVRDLSDAPLALFGHSLGAALAYETALRLERSGIPLAQLFVSAHPAPHLQRGGTLHLGDDDALLRDIRRQGGPGNGLLDDSEMRAMFLPIARADYQVIETYRPRETIPLRCPIGLLLGETDTEVSEPEAQGWRRASHMPLSIQRFPGGHFYLVEQRARLIESLLTSCQTDAGPGSPTQTPSLGSAPAVVSPPLFPFQDFTG